MSVAKSPLESIEFETCVELFVYVAGEIAIFASENTTAAFRKPVLNDAFRNIESISLVDFRLAEFYRFASIHENEIKSSPDKFSATLPLLMPDQGKLYLAQANKSNAAEFLKLTTEEKRFGLFMIASVSFLIDAFSGLLEIYCRTAKSRFFRDVYVQKGRDSDENGSCWPVCYKSYFSCHPSFVFEQGRF